jgi:hypothetical protein
MGHRSATALTQSTQTNDVWSRPWRTSWTYAAMAIMANAAHHPHADQQATLAKVVVDPPAAAGFEVVRRFSGGWDLVVRCYLVNARSVVTSAS